MPTLQHLTVGFIGLGLMGRPMALNLQRAGATLVVHNRSPGPMDEMRALGMRTAASPAEVARAASVCILMLTDTPSVQQVVTGPQGLLEGMGAGDAADRLADRLVIDMGTTAVTATRELAARAAGCGAGWVDAPVSGGTAGAESGRLAIMAGGSDADLARAMPLLEVLGETITHVGAVGAGQVAKAANQVIVGLNIGAVAEALSLARRAGVDPARVRDAIAGGFAGSKVLEVHGRRMVEGSFEPGARCTVQHKDMSQALELAASLGLELPATELNRALYRKLIDAGLGGLDHSALIKAIDDA